MKKRRSTLFFIVLLALFGRAGLAAPAQGSDIILGNGTAGPFPLAWKQISANTESVQVDSVPQTRGLDYTLDPVAGTLTFTRPLAQNAAAAVTYQYDTTQALRNGGGLALPLSFALAQNDNASVSFNALYKQDAAATSTNTPGFLSFGLGTSLKGAGDSALKTHLLFAPALSTAETEQAPNGLNRTGLSLAGNTTSGKLAQFSFGFARAGVGVTDTGGDSSLQAGMQTLTLGSRLTPSKQVLATLNYSKSDSLNPNAPGTSNQTGLGITVTPSSKVQAQANLAQNTAAGQTTDTVGLSAKATLTPKAAVNASYALNNAGGVAADTQAMNLAAALNPNKAVALGASVGQSRLGTTTTNQQAVTLALNPHPVIQLNTGLTLQQTGPWDTTIASVGAKFQPASYLQVSGGYKNRVAAAADPNALDGLDTSTAQVALIPVKSLKLTGTYAQNPDDTTLQRLSQRGLGLETTMGALSLNGGYAWSRQYDTPQVGTTVHVGLGLRFSSGTQLTAGYQQALTGLGLTPAGTNAYSLGFTHSLSDRFSLSLNGTLQQPTGPAQVAVPQNDYNASANLGVKF